MNWDAIGAIGEICGAIAVVATLYYLAVQIRESAKQARQAEVNTNLQQVSPSRMALAQSEQLASVLAKGLEDYHALSPAEVLQFDAFMSERFWVTSYTWARIRQGLVPEKVWEGLANASTLSTLRTPGGSHWLDLSKDQFSKSFRDELVRIRGEWRDGL